MKRYKQFEKAAESEVWNAITAFQEILSAIPGDRTALETLFEAYDHLGDKKKALQYLMELAQQVFDEADADGMTWVLAALQRLGGGVEQAESLIGHIADGLKALGVDTTAPRPGRMSSEKKNIDSEMNLAWRLLQAEEITNDEYSMIAQDLSENSTKNVEVPVTLLHVLNDRAFKNYEHIMVFLSRESGMPIVSLADFELNRAALTLLPGTFRQHKGAIPFELIAEEVMLAVLNPDNMELRQEVEQTIGRTCHFYLVGARDYDAALTRIQHMLQTATA